MEENKQIRNYNDKGSYHGYQQWYYDDKLWFRGNSKHGLNLGYIENHTVKRTTFVIK